MLVGPPSFLDSSPCPPPAVSPGTGAELASPGPCAQSQAASAVPVPRSDVGSLPHPCIYVAGEEERKVWNEQI